MEKWNKEILAAKNTAETSSCKYELKKFKYRKGLNFFKVQFTITRFSNVLSCEDLLISSLKIFSALFANI